MVLAAKPLLTILTLGYGVIPAILDLAIQGDGPVADPPGPATRHHLVWQVLSHDLIVLVARP